LTHKWKLFFSSFPNTITVKKMAIGSSKTWEMGCAELFSQRKFKGCNGYSLAKRRVIDLTEADSSPAIHTQLKPPKMVSNKVYSKIDLCIYLPRKDAIL